MQLLQSVKDMNVSMSERTTAAGVPSFVRLASLTVADGQNRIVSVLWAAGRRQGREDRVDLSPLIDTLRVYAPLRKNPALFETIHLIEDGYAVAWGDDDAIDMPAESVERLAEEVMTRADFSGFLERHALTHQAAASALGRSKRQIENYLQRDGVIPRVVALACYGYEARRRGVPSSRAVHPAAEPQGYARAGGFHEEAMAWKGPALSDKSAPGDNDLLVHNADEGIVRALRERAMAHGRSNEAEHRAILAEALARPRKRSFAEVLASMPDVGMDADFERVQSGGEAPRVFD